MKDKLNILMISPECVPFAKTGGLADVVGALPTALKKLGHNVRVVMPKYSFIDAQKHKIQPFMDSMGVWMGNTEEWCAVHKSEIEGDVPVYFIEFELYFNREGLYHDNEFNDYQDNPRRFAFLTRAALQLCKDTQFKPDIVHANDWQTGLASAYLKVWHWDDSILGDAASLLTIHNIAYQGVYPKSHYDYIGLQESNFTSHKLESHGHINFLKGGIYFSDMVNTVSPSYANETRTPDGGYGLAPYLNNKGDNYIGILNGVDYNQWSPETDKYIPAHYSASNLEGKKQCKKELQRRFNLDIVDDIPVIGIVSRFVSQKGLHIVADTIENIVNSMRVQFAVLGSGDKYLERFYRELHSKYSGKIGTYIGYSNELAHIIEAGSDFFLMPSLYEPCGLNQIYSLRYGTLPIVRRTGGLEDTVEQYNEYTGEGTGFKFWDANAHSIYYTIGWAVSTYYDRKHHMSKLIQNAMSKHFSWEDSAKKYVKAYQKAIKNKKSH
jgi:starch synthase